MRRAALPPPGVSTRQGYHGGGRGFRTQCGLANFFSEQLAFSISAACLSHWPTGGPGTRRAPQALAPQSTTAWETWERAQVQSQSAGLEGHRDISISL